MIRRNFKLLLPGLLWLLVGLAGRGVVAQSALNQKSARHSVPADSLRGDFAAAKQLRGQGKYAAAALEFEAVLAGATTEYGTVDTFTARVHLELGLVRYFSGEFRQALSDYQAALAAFRKAPGTTARDTLECFYRTGVVLRGLGDFYRAEDFIEAALAVEMADSAPNPTNLGKYHNALGNITLRQARYALARHHFLLAWEAFRTTLPENSVYIGALCSNLGVAYLELDSLPQARETQDRARRIFEEKLPPTHPAIGNAYLNLGEVYLAQQEYAAAEAAFRQAQELWRAKLSPRHVNHATAYNRLGDVRLAEADGPGALRHYQEALAALAPGLSPVDWRAEPVPDSVLAEVELLETWTRKARALAQCHARDSARYRLEDVFAVYHRISGLTARMRRGYRRESSQQFLSGQILPAYEEAIALAWSAGTAAAVAEGFAFAEQSKAVLLHAALRGVQAREYAGVPSDLLRRETAQKEALVALNQQLDRLALGESPEKRAEYRNLIGERFQLEQGHEALLDTFARGYPRYFELKYAHEVVQLPALQAALRQDDPAEGSAMLVYFWGDAHLYAWAITGSRAKLLRLGAREAVAAACDTLLARVNGRLPLEAASRALYAQVVAPLLAALDGPAPDRLTVVRDGKLEYVPFALLMDAQGRYLVERCAISYAASATLDQVERRARTVSAPYLGLAMTFPDGITLREAVREQYLAALPHTAREVAAGESVFGGIFLQDTAATETAFRDAAGQYEVLHLATHTLIDDRNPLYSRLLLQGGGEVQDGLLHTYELFGLDLNAGLVVLSACNTGRGSLQRGEGMMSLSRGFAYAGCPSILMTHWTVSDRQNADLMAEFFRGLAAGLPKDKALQQAQLAYLGTADEITGHPWYWAAPGLVGEVAPLAFAGKGAGWVWWLGLAVVIVLPGVWAWKRKLRRSG